MPENIPVLLRDQARWIGWKAGSLKPNGKFAKVPADLRTGQSINGRDNANWASFSDVYEAYDREIVDGVGFALSNRKPIMVDGAEYYVAVADFDQCQERMNELHRLWLKLENPWAEISPSMNGIHMWGLVREPLNGGNAGDGRELYSGGRFVTVTGIGSKGKFGECSKFVELEREWFPVNDSLQVAAQLSASANPLGVQSNIQSEHWFEQLSPLAKNTCLAEMLLNPAVIALADTPDDAPSPNWRTIVAACARSGATDAYQLCRAWAQTSPRFGAANFDLRWRSYARS